MSNKLTPLDKAKKIPVPEPGTGEIAQFSSIELFCVWMKLNNQKALRWYGGILLIAPADVEEVKDAV